MTPTKKTVWPICEQKLRHATAKRWESCEGRKTLGNAWWLQLLKTKTDVFSWVQIKTSPHPKAEEDDVKMM